MGGTGGVKGSDAWLRSTVLGIVERVSGVLDLDAFPDVVLDALLVIPAMAASYNEVDPRVPRIVERTRPASYQYPPGVHERFAELLDEHPLIAHYRSTGDGSARRISDLMERSAYQRTRLYLDVYRQLGVEFQMSIVLPADPPLVIGIALSRDDHDFADDEVAVLEDVRPSLATAYRNARVCTVLRTALERTVEMSDGHALVLCQGSRLEPVGETAAAIVERWFGGDGVVSRSLATWLERQRSRYAPIVDRAGEPGTPFTEQRGTRVLTARYLPGGPDLDGIVLSDRSAQPEATPFLRAGLLPREADVLALLVTGSDNETIAREFGISTATVRKHLEGIYRRLGVRNRAAAVATGHALLDGRTRARRVEQR